MGSLNRSLLFLAGIASLMGLGGKMRVPGESPSKKTHLHGPGVHPALKRKGKKKR